MLQYIFIYINIYDICLCTCINCCAFCLSCHYVVIYVRTHIVYVNCTFIFYIDDHNPWYLYFICRQKNGKVHYIKKADVHHVPCWIWTGHPVKPVFNWEMKNSRRVSSSVRYVMFLFGCNSHCPLLWFCWVMTFSQQTSSPKGIRSEESRRYAGYKCHIFVNLRTWATQPGA